jgi:L-ascorbate metabolism protein UlaG (beta-lactamase superfamily)
MAKVARLEIMRLTKFTHACVRLENDGRKLLIDPGIWAEDEALRDVTDILVTHEHFDHIDVDRITALAALGSDIVVHAPAPVAEQLRAIAGQVRTVEVGDTFTASGFHVTAVGGRHADIYDGLPGCANIGYLVDGVYHPGDSLFVPDRRVTTLLVPTSAPWLKLAEAIDFVRAVGPTHAYSIHDAMLSDKGETIIDRWLSMKSETAYARIPIGETVKV